jgi:hypothetical protein
MKADEDRDDDLLPDLRRFVAEHPQTCNAYVDGLLRRAVAKLERLNPAGPDRD